MKLLLPNGQGPNVFMFEDTTALLLAAAGGCITELNLLLE